MKIALDIRKIGKRQTGDEIYITNLIKNLAQIDSRNSYYLCTDSYEGESIAKRILRKLPKNFKIVTLTPGNKIFWTQYSLAKFVKEKKIDLVHVQYITPLRLPKKTKLITTIHDISFLKHPEYIQFIDRLLLNFFIPRSLKRADHIIAVSNFTKNEITKNYKTPSSKISTVYNGINKENFKPLREFKNEFINKIRKKYNLFYRYILNISSLQPRKNLPFLIEAFNNYISFYKDDETVLVIGGEKARNYDERIDEILEQNPVLRERVKLIGYIKNEELPVVYAMAHLYVSPSIYEGFNLPLAEVMKSEVPIMASNLSCHKEIVQDAGILFNIKHNKNKFVSQLHKAIHNKSLRKKLIENGLQNIERFDWETCAKETLQIYEGILKR
ncbi:MAG: glycosyltransferase [Candidatus Moranbacteria bacterium]|nr:glycosyltransferase [Candidatus Moranbacteria bacterium]